MERKEYYDVSTLDQLSQFVDDFLLNLEKNTVGATIVTLSGDLGAGKTTFTQYVARALGVQGEVTSPTYVIEQRYDVDSSNFKSLVHIDAYRLEDEQDPYKIGLDKTLEDPHNFVVIEWPEKIQDFLKVYEKVSLSFSLEDEKRFLTIL